MWKPSCCDDEMDFVMDNKAKTLFECLHCGKVVLYNKRTREERWLAEIFSPHDILKRASHLAK